jgi:thymidylate synthase ThyX
MTRRVLTLAPLPPEQCAYALARYSRSPDSILDSLRWVREHDSRRFLESFYFQYGHASIADLGHLAVCFEGISELAATDIEDEPLWDGQARSSRYQDFSTAGFITPPEFNAEDAAAYQAAGARLIAGYKRLHGAVVEHLRERLPRPAEMPEAAYARNLAARAFDVARYLLFLGVPTGVGQVTSIRTLEKQIRRLKASPYAELRELACELADACAAPPACEWDAPGEPLCPTLAKYVDADEYLAAARRDLGAWAAANLPAPARRESPDVDALRPADVPAATVATLLYPVTDRPFRELYELARGWGAATRAEVIDLALGSRTRRDELLREFRGGDYVFDIVMDIGAYRDLHRHRRCYQSRQNLSTALGYETPQALVDAGLASEYRAVIDETLALARRLPAPARDYLLPFATRSRFLFKMDFAQAEYIIKLRTGVKGHFSYRNVAWQMREALGRIEPELARIISATPPWTEDPLNR